MKEYWLVDYTNKLTGVVTIEQYEAEYDATMRFVELDRYPRIYDRIGCRHIKKGGR